MDGAAEAAAGAVLTVDLGAVVANWRALRDRLGGAECGAVVKADAYGLGAARVAPALAAAGARRFFVAHLAEGAALRPLLPAEARVYVLNGLPPGTERDAAGAGLIPVLNSLAQLAAWKAEAGRAGRRLPAVAQIDSGMARLGMEAAEVRRLGEDPTLTDGLDLDFVMSHLACADEPDHPANAAQRDRFDALRRTLPKVLSSLQNSSGIFLGDAYRRDIARPGAALYGVNPTPGRPNPMRPVVRLRARVIQTRAVGAGDAVGYGWSWTAPAPTRIATLSVGYADGWMRRLGGAGACAWLGDLALPVVGRVSMDSVTVDAGAAPDLAPGTALDLIGPRQDVDAVAALAGTIGYEVLTSLGSRYARRYVGP
jgi:alanine racemase